MPRGDPDTVLADLFRHPGWEHLDQLIRENQKREAETLRDHILRGPGGLDPLKLERVRGYWAGQRWVMRQVRHEFSAVRRSQQETPPTR